VPDEPLKDIQPTKGRPIDRIAFPIATSAGLRADEAAGVKIIEPITDRKELKMKSFLVEGPSKSRSNRRSQTIPEGTWD